MEIVYFHSDSHDYASAIYPGVGPAFAKPLGWRTVPISQLAQVPHDVAVIDQRLEADDVTALRTHLAKPHAPLFFRVSDSDMPTEQEPNVRFIFACADLDGVHYAPTYGLAGPLLAFSKTLKRSRLAHLPYSYDAAREVDVPMSERLRLLFISGASHASLYPRRAQLRRRLRWNPLLWGHVHDLAHPGYPDGGRPLRHGIVRDRFVLHAAQFTHFFVEGSRHESEFMKFLECAYAGSVPVGVPAATMSAEAAACFRPWQPTARGIKADLQAPEAELMERAAAYRTAMKALRDPQRVTADFIAAVRSAI